MLDPSSRHARLPTYQVPAADGGASIELFVPRTIRPGAGVLEHRVTHDDRMDLLAARYFDDPAQFWRIADANPAPRPDDRLVAGETLVIPGLEAG